MYIEKANNSSLQLEFLNIDLIKLHVLVVYTDVWVTSTLVIWIPWVLKNLERYNIVGRSKKAYAFTSVLCRWWLQELFSRNAVNTWFILETNFVYLFHCVLSIHRIICIFTKALSGFLPIQIHYDSFLLCKNCNFDKHFSHLVQFFVSALQTSMHKFNCNTHLNGNIKNLELIRLCLCIYKHFF